MTRPAGVYFLFRGASLLYVGISIDVYQRLDKHHIDGWDRARWMHVEEAALRHVERALIHLFDPPRNTRARYGQHLAAYGLPRIPTPEDRAILDAIGIAAVADIETHPRIRDLDDDAPLGAALRFADLPTGTPARHTHALCSVPGCYRTARDMRGICENHASRAAFAAARGCAPSLRPIRISNAERSRRNRVARLTAFAAVALSLRVEPEVKAAALANPDGARSALTRWSKRRTP